MRRVFGLVGALCLVSALAACGDSDATPLAPTVSGSALASSAPKTASSKKYVVDGGASKVSFMMDAPDEKIRGRVEGTIEGSLFIDAKDLTQTTGNIIVDLGSLVLFQKKKDDKGEFSTEERVEKQNEHARQWLEIDPSTPEDMRKKNQRVEFRISSVENVSQKDVSTATGEIKVTLKAKGDFLLHQRQSVKTADLEATLQVEGGVIKSISIKTKAPFGVGLAEHDVRPRESFGKLAAKGLDALGSKVAKDAMVDFDLKLAIDGSAMTPMPTTPPSAETPAPAASASNSAAAQPSASAATSASAAPATSAPVKSTPSKPK
ncbi:MAG: hypothetical protein U0271_46955 [Polyangiaceae bacterium]